VTNSIAQQIQNTNMGALAPVVNEAIHTAMELGALALEAGADSHGVIRLLNKVIAGAIPQGKQAHGACKPGMVKLCATQSRFGCVDAIFVGLSTSYLLRGMQ
jgi:hypothetical protein